MELDNNRYQPLVIEKKWQQVWQDQAVYEVDLKQILKEKKPKFYAFGMFNYPSGEGIHVGHVKNFTLPDVLIRAKRQQGYLVYAPVGFDSFGLPAENYALKTGTPPRLTTDQAIANYTTQYKACGFSFDWSKVIDTSSPQYYRWTQWCFLQLYKAGLAYRKESSQWWCGLCRTVLADEQVINGRCWRHDGKDDPLIGKKVLKQWFFKITALAPEILKATQTLDWTPWVKTAQQNYIGQSDGFNIKFSLLGLADLKIDELIVFTTALETLHGATFIVLAPEHPLVDELIKLAKNKAQISDYQKQAQTKSEIDRLQVKDKTGVLVQDLHVINPLTKDPMPIWIADYVLASYGTGAIMAVPGADERDLKFAQKHHLKIIYLTKEQEFIAYKDLCSKPDTYKLKTEDELDGLSFDQAKVEIFKKLKSVKKIDKKTNFKLRDWLISRQRYWGAPIPIVHCPNCGIVPVPEADLPVELPEIDDYSPAGDGRSPLTKVKDWVNVNCPNCKALAQRETDTMDGYVCSSWYPLRYLSPHDEQKAWDTSLTDKWMPVDFYNGADHATAHLIYARFFSRFFYHQNLLSNPEPFKKMYLHAKILAPDGQFFSKSKGNGINPLDIIEQGYGADALRVYICAIAPPDVEATWNHHGVPGAYRFLNRVWLLIDNYLKNKPVVLKPPANTDQQILKATHRCIFKNNNDLKTQKLNTALAAQMTLVNTLYKISQEDNFENNAWQFALESLTMLLAPFAPHLASELWQKLGHADSVHLNHWPKLESQYLSSSQITLAVQVNGKLRGELKINSQATEKEILTAAKQLQGVARYLNQGEIVKETYVFQKIVYFLVR